MKQLRPIREIVTELGLTDSDVEYFGEAKAKLKLSTYQKLRDKPDGNLILVSAITPTPAGEGKTTTSIGLAMGLNRIGETSIVTLREPSLGPLFGMKGGATGGGKTQVHPIDDINMHFTGDLHAVTAAHNLISAVVDNHLFRQKEPHLDPRQVVWNRVMDMNDRSLREIVIGLGGKKNGFPRETNFSITASSEVMAILGLSESYSDLKDRIGNIFLGYTYDNEPVYLKQLNITGAVAALLKDALKPNLVQTSDGTPAFVHGGPFANIAQGACSTFSMKMALKLSDYVITEAGFGFDLGAEKFFDIVARKSGLNPKAVVLVATIRALKMHGGKSLKELNESDPAAVKRGMPNLLKHVQNICHFKVPAVVAINKFDSDTIEEIEVVQHVLNGRGIENAVIDSAGRGSEGAVELAHKVVAISQHDEHYQSLYTLESSIEEKVGTVCKEIYGSEAVDFTKDAQKAIVKITKLGLDKLPVCIAKTQKSLSDNPELLGRPKDFLVTVRDVQISSGAGFLVPITGEMLLMPGLPNVPTAENVNIDDDGNITGMF
ncbi:MAG: formate--tetrahydrofolate ligase [Candidatus Marinimicrobia bacterium]|nr:formate--tetrahydrofolate ligase [Candidatus Neomarinimicrobiota bacterium]